MNDDLKNNVICGCSGTTIAQVQTLIGEGVVDIDGVSRITGALSGCGGCEYDLKNLLEKPVAQEILD